MFIYVLRSRVVRVRRARISPGALYMYRLIWLIISCLFDVLIRFYLVSCFVLSLLHFFTITSCNSAIRFGVLIKQAAATNLTPAAPCS
jgi:hypothetical protein